jgi:uncharacterized membrane protein YbaN (DUF454 family)
MAPMHADDSPAPAPKWLRLVWLGGGSSSLLLGVIGIFVPELPTTPFVLLAAFCFARGSPRWERWLLAHPRFGPYVRDWREQRAVPLRAKQLATVMMVLSSLAAWWSLAPSGWRWVPGGFCSVVALWLWRLPTARQRPR